MLKTELDSGAPGGSAGCSCSTSGTSWYSYNKPGNKPWM